MSTKEKQPKEEVLLPMHGRYGAGMDRPQGPDDFDPPPPFETDDDTEAYWAGRNKAARLSARVAA